MDIKTSAHAARWQRRASSVNANGVYVRCRDMTPARVVVSRRAVTEVRSEPREVRCGQECGRCGEYIMMRRAPASAFVVLSPGEVAERTIGLRHTKADVL